MPPPTFFIDSMEVVILATAFVISVLAEQRRVTWRAPVLGWVAIAFAAFAVSRLVFSIIDFELDRANTEWYWGPTFALVIAVPWALARFACVIEDRGRLLRAVLDVGFAVVSATTIIQPAFYAVGQLPIPPEALVWHIVSAIYSAFAALVGIWLMWRSARRRLGEARRYARRAALAIVLVNVLYVALGVRDFPIVIALQAAMVASMWLYYSGTISVAAIRSGSCESRSSSGDGSTSTTRAIDDGSHQL